MYVEPQPIETITREELAGRVAALTREGHRLVHIACTSLADAFEVTYAFDRDYQLINLRLLVPRSDPVVPSISGALLAAFTYENELQDLFGIRCEGLVLDFKGRFYRKASEKPFACAPTSKAAKPAAAAQPTQPPTPASTPAPEAKA